MFIAKIYDYVPVRTKVYELVDGVFKKSHRAKWGREIDLDNPKCRICNDALIFKNKGISKINTKYVEMLQRNDIPDIVLVGHFHKFDYSYPREVHVIQVGCLQDQTPFMRKRRLQAAVGGCIIRVKQANNGMILSLNVEWIPFYDKKFYEYKW